MNDLAIRSTLSSEGALVPLIDPKRRSVIRPTLHSTIGSHRQQLIGQDNFSVIIVAFHHVLAHTPAVTRTDDRALALEDRMWS
jgi:hypothetical protein